eukprot:scpid59863/ scgid12008/ Zonadhesin
MSVASVLAVFGGAYNQMFALASVLAVVSLSADLASASHSQIALSCPSNSTSSCCIRPCHDTCQGTGTTFCSRRCVPGCECDTGYVRHGTKCVRKRKCSRIVLPLADSPEATELRQISEGPIGCPANFTATCSPQTCHFTCTNHTLLRLGTLYCPPGATLEQPVCICQNGYVRKGRSCVLPKDCPPIPRSRGDQLGPPTRGPYDPRFVTSRNPVVYTPPDLEKPTLFPVDRATIAPEERITGWPKTTPAPPPVQGSSMSTVAPRNETTPGVQLTQETPDTSYSSAPRTQQHTSELILTAVLAVTGTLAILGS